MAKIYLDIGHGGRDPGAVGRNSHEANNVLKVGLEIAKLLRSSGHTVKLSRTKDVYLTLSQRTNDANAWGADIFVSLHNNAASSASATGFETFIYNGKVNSNTRNLQNAIHDAIISEIGIRDRGKKRANFAVVRQSRMPAVLIEYAFISNINDEEILINEVGKLARITAKGINDYFGVSGSTSKSTPKKSSKPKSKSIAELASEVIAGKHGSGHSNRRKSLGISSEEYEKVRAEVNRRLTGKSTPKKNTKSISQMATEVILGKHGNGHENRRKSLGISKAEYEKVRKEVNRRLK